MVEDVVANDRGSRGEEHKGRRGVKDLLELFVRGVCAEHNGWRDDQEGEIGPQETGGKVDHERAPFGGASPRLPRPSRHEEDCMVFAGVSIRSCITPNQV